MTVNFEEGFVEKIKATGNKIVNLNFISGIYLDTDGCVGIEDSETDEMRIINVGVNEIRDRIKDTFSRHFKYIFSDATFKATMVQEGKDVTFLLMRV